MFANRKQYYSFWDRKNFEYCVCRVKNLCFIQKYEESEIIQTIEPDPHLVEIENIEMNGFPYHDGMIKRYQALGRISRDEFKRLRSVGARRL